MEKIYIWKLRLRKWFFTRWAKLVYPNLPFEIARCDLAESYEPVTSKDKILAEFDAGGKHWAIFKL